MSAGPITLTLAHSPDPDDVFMWWPLTGMIDPADRRTVLYKPELDTGRFRFAGVPEDIAVLNCRAAEAGDLDITALSIFAWAQARVRERYALTSFGASMGRGYGPCLVARTDFPDGVLRAGIPIHASTLASPVCYADDIGPSNTAAAARAASASSLRLPPSHFQLRIAVPGVNTTAFLLLSMILGPGAFKHVEMPFDRILDAVERADQGVNAGLLIHQSQLTFADLGLEVLIDTGAWWLERTGLPLPLGGNALRRDLDERHGPGTTREVALFLHRSILHALEHRDRSIAYAMRWAPELSREQAARYIDMYVNDLTVDAGSDGSRAVQRLLDEGARLGLCPAPGAVTFIRPE